MTKIANPLKNFHYILALNGFDQALVQSIEIGELELSENLHGDGMRDIKTPGRLKIPDIVMEKLVPIGITDPEIWTWFIEATLNLASATKRDFIITQLSGETGFPVRVWAVEGAWVKKYKPSKIGDMEDSNSIDTVTFACDDIIPIQL